MAIKGLTCRKVGINHFTETSERIPMSDLKWVGFVSKYCDCDLLAGRSF